LREAKRRIHNGKGKRFGKEEEEDYSRESEATSLTRMKKKRETKPRS